MRITLPLFYSLLIVFGCNAQQKQTCEKWTGAEDNLSCGRISVPGDWKNPEKGEIDLFYVKLNATGNNPQPDPIIFLQGGPGGSATPLVNFFLNSALRLERDIIIMDQRGTGYSSAQCTEMSDLYFEAFAADLTPLEESASLLNASQQCTQSLEGIFQDKSIFNSNYIISDFEALRKELGVVQWNILGASYGSRLGLTYLREHPESIRSAALQGLFPPEAKLYANLISNMDRSLKLLYEKCSSSPDCNLKHPDLRATFENTVKLLAHTPYKFDYQGQNFTVNAQDYILMVLYSMYGRQSIENMPALIEAINKENTTALTQAVGRVRTTLDVINGAMYMSVAAFEELPFSGLADIQEQLTDLPYLKPGPAFFISDPYLLEKWHPFRATALEDTPVKSDHPVLLISGKLDPVTPPENTASMLLHLSNARHIIFEDESHANFDPCYFHLLVQFFNNPEGDLSDCHKNENRLTLN